MSSVGLPKDDQPAYKQDGSSDPNDMFEPRGGRKVNLLAFKYFKCLAEVLELQEQPEFDSINQHNLKELESFERFTKVEDFLKEEALEDKPDKPDLFQGIDDDLAK